LVANTINKLNSSVPSNGLTPTISILENPSNYSALGNINEPLLAAAIADIQGAGRFNLLIGNQTKPVATSSNLRPHIKEMYIDEVIFNDLHIN